VRDGQIAQGRQLQPVKDGVQVQRAVAAAQVQQAPVRVEGQAGEAGRHESR
jgi:hypothetical protein